MSSESAAIGRAYVTLAHHHGIAPVQVRRAVEEKAQRVRDGRNPSLPVVVSPTTPDEEGT